MVAVVRCTILALALPACSLFNGGGSTTDGGGTYGYGRPTLQVTIGGATYGPSVLDSSSYVDVVDEGVTGQLTHSSVTLFLSSAATGASCSLRGERFGVNVQPIIANVYTLVAPTGAQTQDGTVGPGSGESMVVPDGSFSCAGSDCDGGALVFTVLQRDHAEGYLNATLNDSLGRGSTSGTCSFWAPVRTYTR